MGKLIEVARSMHIDVVMEAAQILADNGIKFMVDNTKPTLDLTFIAGSFTPVEYILKVKEEDVEKAMELIEEM